MRRPGFLIALILLAAPAAAQDLQSYPPSKTATAPKLINAEVTKADTQTGLVTFRSESGDVLVTAGREVTAGMALRPGDKVLIAFRDVKDASGFPSRVVTEVRLAAPASGAPARPASASAAPKKRNVAAAPAKASGTAPATATGSMQAGGTSAAQAGGATTTAGTPAAAGTVTTSAGGAVATGAGTSPYTNPVPSVNSAAPVVTAVLPPAGAKAPLTEAEVGTMRAQGLRDLDASAVALAAVANDIDTAWFRFKNQCLKGPAATGAGTGREWFAISDVPAPADDNDTCRTMRTELTARVKQFQGQLGIVEDAARKADLLPAQVREVLDRHRLIR
jgi:hypothetical protein